MVTISGNINYITMNYLKNKSKGEIIKVLPNVIKIYQSRGFDITNIYGDNEFNMEDLQTSMLPASMSICVSNEHIPKIERSTRTIKQRAHRMCHSIPYNRYTRVMTKSLACTVV